jgi:hypothetical protein
VLGDCAPPPPLPAGGVQDLGNSRNDGRATPGMNLSPDDFAAITAEVLAVARVCCPGRVVSVLEGGYGRWALMPYSEAIAQGVPIPPAQQEQHEAAPATAPEVMVPYIVRDNLGDACAAHLRALVDGAAGPELRRPAAAAAGRPAASGAPTRTASGRPS